MSKFSKSDKIQAIADFFAEQGKRMSNLNKALLPRLDEIIKEHKINVKEQYEKRQAMLIKEKEERKERQRQHEAEQKAEEDARLEKWNSITEAQQMIICEKIAQHDNANNQKDYERDIAVTDKLQREATNAGSRVMREGPTIVRINGVIVQQGWGEPTVYTKEHWFGKMPRAIYNRFSVVFATSILADIEQMNAENKELALMSAEDINVAVAKPVAVAVQPAEPVVCAYCKKPTARCEMHWENNQNMTELCESCVKSGIEKNPWSKKKVVKRRVVKKPVVAEPVAEPVVPEEKEMIPEEVYGLAYATIENLQKEVADLKAQLAEAKAPQKRVVKRVVKSKEAVVKNTPVKKTPESKARPTFHLAKMNAFNYDYTLFKHERGGFCKYAVYNNTANHYVACGFDGNKIIGWGAGTIYKTLNAWTTANWAEQRKKDGNNKTTRNNAYRETKYIPLQMNDLEAMEYGPLHEDVEWESSMSIQNK